MTLERELLKIDLGFWSGGPEAYRHHADDKVLVVFKELAGIMSRDDIAKSAEKGRWPDLSPTPKGLVRLSDTSAVLSYQCAATRKDGQPYHAIVSSGYIKRPDGWKLAFHRI